MKNKIMEKDIRKIVEEGYDKADYAGKFRTNFVPNEMERKFLERFIGQIGTKAKVLDFGCGTGVPFDKFLVENGVDIMGIDISQKHIDMSKKNIPTAKFIKGDFSKFEFGKQKFDGIISLYAIFHIPREEHKDLFIKMYNLLSKNGVILVTLGTSGSKYSEEQNWCGAPMAWSTYNPDTYKQILNEIGFKIIEDAFEGNPGDEEYHYWVLAKK